MDRLYRKIYRSFDISPYAHARLDRCKSIRPRQFTRPVSRLLPAILNYLEQKPHCIRNVQRSRKIDSNIIPHRRNRAAGFATCNSFKD